MLTTINGTIKLVDEGGDQRLQLIIPRSNYEKFKEYENLDWDTTVIDNEFYVGFTLGNE